MSVLAALSADQASAFLTERIGEKLVVINEQEDLSQFDLIVNFGLQLSPEAFEQVRANLHKIRDGEVIGIPLADNNLILAGVPVSQREGFHLLTLVPGQASLATRVVRNAVEAWSFKGQADLAQETLRESAKRLDHSHQPPPMHLHVDSNELFLGTLHAMSRAIDARDKYTQGHSQRVARLSYELARLMGLSDKACQEIYLAGILHDIGKIGIPDRVLLKDGGLSEREFAIIRKHPEIGYRIIERLGHLQFVLAGVLYHHERWDGNGYPHQLTGASIPLMARIMAVADAFDAMTSCRPYRTAMAVEKAHGIIRRGAAEQWDAQIVACLNDWISNRQQEVKQPFQNASIIPDESPVEHIGQAVMALLD